MTWDEVEELACLMLGKDYDSIVNNYEEDTIEDMFYNEYNIDLSTFKDILDDLIEFTPSWVSPLTGELYQGFVTRESKGLMRAVIKQKVKI